MRVARVLTIELLLAGTVLLTGLVQLATRNFAELGPPPHPDALATAPDGLGLLLVFAAAAAVLLRRKVPLTALVLTSAASIAALALSYGVIVHLGPAVVLYEIARRDVRWHWLAAAAVATVSLVTIASLERNLLDAQADFVIDLVLWAGAAAAGAGRRIGDAREAEHRRQEQVEAAADERVRIARELHDSAGHAITNIAAYAGAARVLRKSDPERADEAVSTIEALAREAVDEIDEIVNALRDDDEADLRPQPSFDRLDDLVEQRRAAGLALGVTRTGKPRSLAPGVDRAAYRIVQEGLTNASRHGTGTAKLSVGYGRTALELEITNPVALRLADERVGGRGILGMRERAALLGGALSIDERAGRFVLRTKLPYGRDDHVS